MESLYDLLFELSNEYRCDILVLLSKEPLRVTEIAKHQGFTTQEISRNLARLNEVGLTYKDVEGFYHLSPLGELTITLLREFEFISKHKNYFINHRVNHLPPEFLKSLSEISGSHETKTLMDFLHYMDTLINESKEFVNLLVDQYPLMAIESMTNAIHRGVKIRIIESSETTSGPSMDLASLEDSETINRVGFLPHVEQRTMKRVDEFIILSESKCAIAFPTRDGKFDYVGFVSSDEKSMRWCSGLFQYSWENTGKGIEEAEAASEEQLAGIEPPSSKLSKIVLKGKNGEGDAQALQYAVNNYKEVVLRGTFELGKQSILVDRSVTIKGEGRKDGFPSTRLHKRGWVFPSTSFDSVFNIVGKDVDVTIENIHFTDFNCSCIHSLLGRSLSIRNNAITLGSGYGRGWVYERFGDLVTGIWVDVLPEHVGENNFDAGVTIEKNYIDFAFQPKQNVPVISPELIPDKYEYLPDLNKHEYYIGIGINIQNLSGKISIKENTILNMNGRGISVTDNLPTSVVGIRQNLIKSEVKGSYPFTGDDAGFGVFAQCSFMYRRLGFRVEVEDNVLQLLKPDYCGITVLELSLAGKSSEFMNGSVNNNQINLLDGTTGLRIGSKSLDVSGNKITGSAHFGVQTIGFRTVKDHGSEGGSRIKDNDVSELAIRDPNIWRVRRRVVD